MGCAAICDLLLLFPFLSVTSFLRTKLGNLPPPLFFLEYSSSSLTILLIVALVFMRCIPCAPLRSKSPPPILMEISPSTIHSFPSILIYSPLPRGLGLSLSKCPVPPSFGVLSQGIVRFVLTALRVRCFGLSLWIPSLGKPCSCSFFHYPFVPPFDKGSLRNGRSCFFFGSDDRPPSPLSINIVIRLPPGISSPFSPFLGTSPPFFLTKHQSFFFPALSPPSLLLNPRTT